MSSAYSRPGSRRCVCRSTNPGSRTWSVASMTSAFDASGREPGADFGDLAVVDQDVDPLALAVGAHSPISTVTRPPPPPDSMWNSTAIRTCTPLETCCSTADCEESATEDAISMPRTIGPGCSTTACSGNIAGADRTARSAPNTPAPTGRTRRSSARPAPAASARRRRRAARRRGRGRPSTGQPSTPTGSNVGGATRTTSAPSVRSSMTLERATRLCRTSPTITHAPALDAAEPLPDGQRVQQRLCRVFMRAVAGVDHRGAVTVGARPLGEQVCGAGGRSGG